ncbi:MAG: toxin-antitoxin system YwqK family antitoxin [Bacteroidota bacterium]
MLRIFMIFLLAIFSFSVFSQDTLNITDSQGRKQGFWRKVDSLGRPIYEGRFKDGFPGGEFRYFYPDGKLKTVSVILNQGKKARTVSYFPNGRKMAAGVYLNEKKDSTWQFFSESNGTLVSEQSFQAGLANGPSKVFYPDGGLSEIRNFRNGIMEGIWEQYYLEGKLKLHATYKAGEKQGSFQTFYSSGKIMISGQYDAGHQDGPWVYYNENGSISKKEIYAKGNLIKVEEPGKK